MHLYIFGNPDYQPDAQPFQIIEQLQAQLPDLTYEVINPNQDLPFIGQTHVVILDTILGITKPTLIQDDQLDKIKTSPRSSVHDYDLGFQLKYLKKLGKIGKVTIVGIPMTTNVDISAVVKCLQAI